MEPNNDKINFCQLRTVLHRIAIYWCYQRSIYGQCYKRNCPCLYGDGYFNALSVQQNIFIGGLGK